MFKLLLFLATAMAAMALGAAELPDFVTFSRRTGVFNLPAINAVAWLNQFGPEWQAATQGMLRPAPGYPVFTDGFAIKGTFKSGGALIPLKTSVTATPGSDGKSFRYLAEIIPESPVASKVMSLELSLGTDEELPVLRVDSQKVAIPETPGSAILFDRPMTDNLAVATAAGTLYIYGTCTVFIQDGRNRNRIVVRLIPLGIKPVISDWKLDLEFVFVSADKPANVKTTAQ